MKGKHDSSAEGFLSRMALNDNKAGMEGLDRDKINKIILEASKGSRFYESELKKEQQVNQRIEGLKQQRAKITEPQLRRAQAQVDKITFEMESGRDLGRIIVHVDMDAFYAAVEMRDHPELRDKPMAVGSMSMLSTSNYYARRFGVRAAMPGFIAKKLCPSLVIVPHNFDKYKAVSKEVRKIFADYDPNFLPMSLDEAYLDITDHVRQRKSWPESRRTYPDRLLDACEGQDDGTLQDQPPPADLSPILFEDSPPACPSAIVFGTSAEEAVREMRFRIEHRTSLTASAGIAPNMMLAKVCSDRNKPNGQYRILAERQAVMDFIQDLPIRKVPGIGKVTEKMLGALDITTCADLRQKGGLLSLLFSEISWHHFLQISMGLGSTHIESDGERKSMSTERTFVEMSSSEEQYSLCRELCRDLAQDLQREGLKGKTVTVKLKNVNFEVKTRASTVSSAVSTEEEIFAAAKDLLRAEIVHASPHTLRLRLMGVRVSGFVSENDRKPLQKCIKSFLQSGRQEPHRVPQCTAGPPSGLQSGALEVRQTSSSGLTRESQTGPVEQRAVQGPTAQQDELQQGEPQSFFLTARARRHDLQGVLQEESTQENFMCPVCFREQESWDLGSFHRHVDMCLDGIPEEQGGAVSDKRKNLPNAGMCDRISDEGELVPYATCPPNSPAFIMSATGVHTHTLSATREGNYREHASDPDRSVSNGHENEARGVAPAPTKSPDPSNCPLLCPVCNVQQETSDLAAFNRHMDVCLNQGFLRDLQGVAGPGSSAGQGQAGKMQTVPDAGGRSKRQRSSPSFAPSKRPKSKGSVNTIDRFFR